MNPQQISAFAGIGLLLSSVGWFALDEGVIKDPGRPTTAKSTLDALIAEVPPIGDFDTEFHINYENPFIPHSERLDEKQKIDPKEIAKRPKPPKIQPTPPPDTPVKVQEPKKLILPTRSAEVRPMPECLGVIRHAVSGQALVLVSFSGNPPMSLAEGEVVQGWKLLSIGSGIATFDRPEGGEEIIIIGSAGTPVGLPGVVPQGNPQGTPQAAPVAPVPRALPVGRPVGGGGTMPNPEARRSDAPAPMTMPEQAPTPVPAGEPVMRRKPRRPNGEQAPEDPTDMMDLNDK